MRREIFNVLLVVPAFILGAVSCSDTGQEFLPGGYPEKTASAELRLQFDAPQMKSVIEPDPQKDDCLETLDVFVFRNTGKGSPDHLVLDAYKRFEGALSQEYEILTTTGPKIICAVANSHIPSYEGVDDLLEFRKLTVGLADEKLGSFSMYGEAEATLDVTSSVTVSMTRMISRIAVHSVRTRFTGTPYEGMPLTDCRLYLVNVKSDKLLYNGSAPAVEKIMNEGQMVPSDVNSTLQAGLLMDDIAQPITETPYETPHYLYAYSNKTQDQQTCTKLVLEGTLAGVKYYYPVLINQEGYGHTDTVPYSGIERNTVYAYNITVTKPGNLDPNDPVVPGSLEIVTEVTAWDKVPEFDKQF